MARGQAIQRPQRIVPVSSNGRGEDKGKRFSEAASGQCSWIQEQAFGADSTAMQRELLADGLT